MEDFRSRCPRCSGEVLIRLGRTTCMSCDWQGSMSATETADVENLTEVRKIGEERFVPPKQPHKHPNERGDVHHEIGPDTSD
jgi:hypothetical protein